MVIGTIKGCKVCECALHTKRPINNNLKWPQDHESPRQGRNISPQGLRRRAFSLSQPVTKPRVMLVRPQALFAAFSSISCLYLMIKSPLLGVERGGKRKEPGREERGRGLSARSSLKRPLCTKHFAEHAVLSPLRLSMALPVYSLGSQFQGLRFA